MFLCPSRQYTTLNYSIFAIITQSFQSTYWRPFLYFQKKNSWKFCPYHTGVEPLLRLHYQMEIEPLKLLYILAVFSQTDSKTLTLKCFQFLEILIFIPYRWGPMPILHVTLEMTLPLHMCCSMFSIQKQFLIKSKLLWHSS